MPPYTANRTMGGVGNGKDGLSSSGRLNGKMPRRFRRRQEFHPEMLSKVVRTVGDVCVIENPQFARL